MWRLRARPDRQCVALLLRRRRVVSQCTAGLPEGKPRYVMGVGYPLDILICSGKWLRWGCWGLAHAHTWCCIPFCMCIHEQCMLHRTACMTSEGATPAADRSSAGVKATAQRNKVDAATANHAQDNSPGAAIALARWFVLLDTTFAFQHASYTHCLRSCERPPMPRLAAAAPRRAAHRCALC